MTTHNKEVWPSTWDPLLTTAAAWFVRVQNDDLDVGEIAEWQQWLAESPGHRDAFDRMQALWESLGQLPDRTLPALSSKVGVAERFRFPRWVYAMAASMLLAVGLGTLYVLNGGISWLTPQATVFKTEAAEHREVHLPDGSRLSLGAQSLVWINFSAERREVMLERGEAFFKVAKDKQRPFGVRAGDATITAIGTAFNVRKTGERVLVAVSEGVVKFAPTAGERSDADSAGAAATAESGRHALQELQLRAGQQIVFEPVANTVSVREAALETISAWRNGRLEYLAEPLKYVVADVNRYSKQPIVIGDPTIGELLVTGTVFERDIDAWLLSVEDILPVTADRSAPDSIVLARRVSAR